MAAVGWLYHKSTLPEEAWMNFYTQQHKHYCGIDLHARAMYVCILDQNGTKLVHKNLPTTPEAFLRVSAPYREDLVVGVECMFTWYWLADLWVLGRFWCAGGREVSFLGSEANRNPKIPRLNTGFSAVALNKSAIS